MREIPRVKILVEITGKGRNSSKVKRTGLVFFGLFLSTTNLKEMTPPEYLLPIF